MMFAIHAPQPARPSPGLMICMKYSMRGDRRGISILRDALQA
jgi:hypothetical protein